jgi:acetyltransferase-like isoleucine patch superfamily enzyme
MRSKHSVEMTEKNSNQITGSASKPGCWTEGPLPRNAKVGDNTIITDNLAFKRFHSRADDALIIGAHSTMDGVHFAVGENGRIGIGEYCYLTSVVLLCEMEIQIGNYVVIGWNTTIADTDFHPVSAAERVADAIACSPLGKDKQRPPIMKRPVIIEDDVWIGPNVTILKGVRIGAGAWIEAGSLVTRDVAPRTRIMGNPAQEIGPVT